MLDDHQAVHFTLKCKYKQKQATDEITTDNRNSCIVNNCLILKDLLSYSLQKMLRNVGAMLLLVVKEC